MHTRAHFVYKYRASQFLTLPVRQLSLAGHCYSFHPRGWLPAQQGRWHLMQVFWAMWWVPSSSCYLFVKPEWPKLAPLIVCDVCDVQTANLTDCPINYLLGWSETLVDCTQPFLCNNTLPALVAFFKFLLLLFLSARMLRDKYSFNILTITPNNAPMCV